MGELKLLLLLVGVPLFAIWYIGKCLKDGNRK